VDFYARQENARRTTRWLLLAFLVSVALVVLAVDAIVYVLLGSSKPQHPQGGMLVFTTVVVLAIICGASLFKTLSLRNGGGVVARAVGGTRVDRNTRDPALRRLHNIVEEMAIASGVTMPEVYVLENEDAINAFAAGNSPAEQQAQMAKSVPLGRMAKAEEVADAIVWLASERASYITGQTILVDGGAYRGL